MAVATAIWLMFSEGDTEGRRLGYFDAIFVEVEQRANGATALGVGLNNAVPLIVTALVVTVFTLMVMAIHDRLLARRRQLLADTD